MSMNLSAKLDELQRGDRQLETTVALCEIRTQLQELTKSVESCQSEVSEVKRDMVAIKVLHRSNALSNRFFARNLETISNIITLVTPAHLSYLYTYISSYERTKIR